MRKPKKKKKKQNSAENDAPIANEIRSICNQVRCNANAATTTVVGEGTAPMT